MTVETLRTALADALPIGTPARAVVRYLDAQGYEHSGYVAAERRIDAIQREAGGSTTVSRSLVMRFDFGADDRLRATDVREVFTGL